jgi:hypothetical protein
MRNVKGKAEAGQQGFATQVKPAASAFRETTVANMSEQLEAAAGMSHVAKHEWRTIGLQQQRR